MSERRGVTFERLARMEDEYADNDDVLDVIHAVRMLSADFRAAEGEVRQIRDDYAALEGKAARLWIALNGLTQHADDVKETLDESRVAH